MSTIFSINSYIVNTVHTSRNGVCALITFKNLVGFYRMLEFEYFKREESLINDFNDVYQFVVNLSVNIIPEDYFNLVEISDINDLLNNAHS